MSWDRKGGRHPASCAAPYPLRVQPGRSWLSRAESGHIIGFVSTRLRWHNGLPLTSLLPQYPRADGSSRILSWRTQRVGKPSKKVLPFILSVRASPDATFCCGRTAGVRGTITRFVITIPTESTTYHFYELDVTTLDSDWLECKERKREWVDYAEAVRRLEWKKELSQGLQLSSLAPPRR